MIIVAQQRGEAIFYAGTQPQSFFVVCTGRVKVTILMNVVGAWRVRKCGPLNLTHYGPRKDFSEFTAHAGIVWATVHGRN